MREVEGHARTVSQLLGGAKYAIDYYQRDYKWQTKQVAELIDDLAGKFLENFKPEHERAAVVSYSHYFLGSIIISKRDTQKFIIDGQQRLTTLTLLLIYLNHRLNDGDQIAQVANLIFSTKFGKRSFNLDIDERTAVMDTLYTGNTFEENDRTESVHNILGRYQDIETHFPEEISDDVLPYFVDWLIENVHLVEITAYSDEDAYEIFETMNDRGLALTPTDMLKGYLLSNIKDVGDRNRASKTWKKLTTHKKDVDREEDSDAIKSWLRSQYANSIRKREPNARPEDFDRIGTEFHRWVRDNEDSLGLQQSSDFAKFIEKDFNFYGNLYYRLREAARTCTPGLETVYYNAKLNFTLQYPVLLASLQLIDSEDEVAKKLRITGSYLDILLARRIWNWRSISYSTMQYAMFLVMRDIRELSAIELATHLTERLATEGEEYTFASNDDFYMTGTNRNRIHYLLARITDYIESESGLGSHFVHYMTARGKDTLEVEHIWANHAERHTDDFPYVGDFLAYRNRIGGLLLLPRSFNRSYGDLPYRDPSGKPDSTDEKWNNYLTQNLLAQSLHKNAYIRNPAFNQFIVRSGLPFRAHEQFRREDLDTRQKLYQKIAERIWDPARLEHELYR